MTQDRYVYRAPDGFGAAWLAQCERINEHNRAVWAGRTEEEKAVDVMVNTDPFGVDRQFVGFSDPGGPKPPVGLSRSQKRPHLIPMRGPSGEPWRRLLAAFAAGPRRSAPFEEFGIPQRTVREADDYTGRTWWCAVAPEQYGDEWVLVSKAPMRPDEVERAGLVEVPLSRYYAMREAATAKAGA
jgi:hypothetical protein